jgi:ADP-heptose:LPS heptosyltransferase
MSHTSTRKTFIGVGGGAEDILHMTFVARQLKMEIPEFELTWAVAHPYAHLLDNNPDIKHRLIIEGDWRGEGWRRICELAESDLYERKTLFHEQMLKKGVAEGNTSRLDYMLKAACVAAWLPRRPVFVPRETDYHVASEFIAANKLQARNQRIIAMEIHPDLHSSPWTPDEYAHLAELLLSRLEVQILLCRGGARTYLKNKRH